MEYLGYILGYIIFKMGFMLIPKTHMLFRNTLHPHVPKSFRYFWACATITHALSLVLPIMLPLCTNIFRKQSLGLSTRNKKLLLIPLKLHRHMLLSWHYLILPFLLKLKLMQASGNRWISYPTWLSCLFPKIPYFCWMNISCS